MKKWLALILLLLVATPAVAEIRISELNVIDMTEDTSIVLATTLALAGSMENDKHRSFEFCVETWSKTTCCVVNVEQGHERCSVYLSDGGEG